MEQSKVKNYLETGSNVAVIAVAVLVIGVFAWQYFAGEEQPSREGLRKGATLSQLPMHDFKSSPHTLIIALNSKCGYCSASIPFYNRITESLRDSAVRTVAVFPNQDKDAQQYVGEKGFKIDSVVTGDFHALKIRSTPTLILVDNSGKILDFWIGRLNNDKEQEVLNTLASLKS